MVNGYLRVYPGRFVKVKGKNQRLNGFIRLNCRQKVSVITGGGAGNEPWSVGFVGDGLADGAVMGAVFTAPPARFIVNVTQALPTDRGALYICTNHAGDVLNYELAGELAQLENIETRCIKVSDDISGLMGERKEERRGQAGVAFVIKIAGAASAAGYSLAETARVAQKANGRLSVPAISREAESWYTECRKARWSTAKALTVKMASLWSRTAVRMKSWKP